MFERFTERARQGVVLAQEESRAFGHDYIGTEHILLGLLREEEGIAAGVLATLGVTVEGVRAQVESIVGHGDAVATGQIPFTPRAKKVLELSLREALALGHNHIGTEHVLLGLVRETDGVAVRILLELDAGPDRVRDEIVNALQGMPTPVRSAAPQQFSRRVPRRARETWLPVAAAGVWALFGLAVGVLLGWAIWG